MSLSQAPNSAKPQAAPVKTAVLANGAPDFKKMTSAEKVAYSRQRIKSDIARNSNGNGKGRA